MVVAARLVRRESAMRGGGQTESLEPAVVLAWEEMPFWSWGVGRSAGNGKGFSESALKRGSWRSPEAEAARRMEDARIMNVKGSADVDIDLVAGCCCC